MKYEKVKELKSDEFRRLTGVKPKIFEKMLEILYAANIVKKVRGGRKNKLSIEDQLLMTFEYLREYRTYFHISQSYGISESAAYKGVQWVEDTLIKHRDFALPGRKERLKVIEEDDAILIDAAETTIERPKKSKNVFTLGRKKSIASKVK